MPSTHAEPYPKTTVGLASVLSVHLDSLRRNPHAYLAAAWWRLCGKRMRSRGQFARLFGASPRAYDVWLKIRARDQAVGSEGAAHCPFIALIDVAADRENIAATLQNLAAEDVPALLVGTPEIPDLRAAAQRIDWGNSPWVMPLSAGDRLARGAADTYRTAIAGLTADVAYADDDLLTNPGKRIAPHFKPDWNGELFRHFDYLSGACVVRTSREALENLVGAEEWGARLVAEAAQKTVPLHIPKMLHHRQKRPRPMVLAAPRVADCNLPPVSVVIPTRNRVDLLRTCLKGLENTDYPGMEVIIVDNDSDEPQTLDFLSSLSPADYRVIRHPGAFNYSRINNRAVNVAQGRLICLLNNDIEVIDPNWLALMVVQALRQDVGAVGAQLLYPDGRIQHAGVVIGMGNAAGHAHRFLRPDQEGYFHRHALPQFVSAVTAACLVVMRDRFLAVGGLDEGNFPVAFNDVDLCMRLNRAGFQSFYEPRAQLIHHESVSRGFDRDPAGAARFALELSALQRLWRTAEIMDPFHHPELSRASERFVVNLER